MSLANQHIINYLDYYTHLEEGPQFAVLINGEWGSGKTWLIRKYFSGAKSKEALHVSLYGAQTADDIADRIFAAMHPVLSSKGAVIAGRIIKGLIKTTVRIDLDRDGDHDLSLRSQAPDGVDGRDLKPRYGGRTLVFDDLERCSLGGQELWGLINRLVEHEKAKVILISHEGGINDAKYRSTKEKNVGMTLTVEPDGSNALEGFLAGMTDTCEHKLRNHQTEILRVFSATGCSSLRVLRFAVRDTCRILGEADEELLQQTTILADLVQASMAIAIGFHGNIIDADSEPDSRSFPAFTKKAFDDQEDRSNAKKRPGFHDYLLGLGVLSAPPTEWWVNVFKRGIINRSVLNQSLRQRYTNEAPDWHRLACFDSLEEEKFIKLMESTWVELNSAQLRSLGPILHVAGVHIWASSVGLSTRSASHIAARAIHALRALTREEILADYDARGLQRHFRSYKGIVYAAEGICDFDSIISDAKKLEEEALNEKARCLSHTLMDYLKSGDGNKFAQALDADPKCKLDDFARFPAGKAITNTNESQFTDALLSLAVEQQMKVARALVSRARHMASEEREWISRVIQELEAESRTRTIRSVMLATYLRQ